MGKMKRALLLIVRLAGSEIFQTMQAVSCCFKVVSIISVEWCKNEISGIPRIAGVKWYYLLNWNKMDDLDSCDFDGFTCSMKNRSIYKRKSGGIALQARNRILNMVKIVEHVDFQRRIEPKSLHKFYRFVDFGVFFELPCEIQNYTYYKKWLVCALYIPPEGSVCDLYTPPEGSVCALYIPPEGSVYSNRSSFIDLEETHLNINRDRYHPWFKRKNWGLERLYLRYYGFR